MEYTCVKILLLLNWEEYGGGYRKKNTYIEYSKNLIDFINAWDSREKELIVNESLPYQPFYALLQFSFSYRKKKDEPSLCSYDRERNLN